MIASGGDDVGTAWRWTLGIVVVVSVPSDRAVLTSLRLACCGALSLDRSASVLGWAIWSDV